MRTHYRFAATLAGALLLMPAAPASARGPAPVAGRTRVSIALSLKPAYPLAGAAVPVASAGQRATAFLESKGFDVTASSPWLITATGTAGQSLAAFGAVLVTDHRGQITSRRPVDVPRDLAGDVSAVIGLEAMPKWRPNAVRKGLTAADLRSAYQIRAPIHSAAGMTVATAQFSGWERTDLETYAAATGQPMPKLTERSIGGADPGLPDGTGGQIEVALDHEALLAAAPGADHVIFFGHNSPVGAAQLYDAVATAAENDGFDVLSISWGFCELEIPRGTLIAINDAMARIVAAGKTVFAAAGDDGAFDCDNPRYAATPVVNFPASSPYVVGVGGSQLTRTAAGAWAEVGWNDTTPGRAAAAGGGGFSRVFARPDWQPMTTADDVSGPARRMVPDIAALADPTSGFGIFVRSDGGWGVGGGTSLASPVAAGHFASALAAVGKLDGLGRALHPILYANPQAFRDIVAGDNFVYAAAAGYDRVAGLGAPLWDQLLPLLTAGPVVSVPAATRSRRIPVTISLPAGRIFSRYRVCESNEDAHCATPDLVLDPAGAPYSLLLEPGRSRSTRIVVVGFDDAGREFPGAAYTTYDASAPTVSAAARMTSPTSTIARFSWGAVDPATGTGVARYESLIINAENGTVIRSSSGSLTSVTVAVTPGSAYTLAVRASDRIGNVSGWKRVGLVVPLDQTQLSFGPGWVTTRTPAAYAGSWVSSVSTGAKATVTVRGRSADLLIATGPEGGLLDVYVGASFSGRIDTYSPVPARQRFVRVARWPGDVPRLLTLRVVGAGNRASRGSLVVIDGLRINQT